MSGFDEHLKVVLDGYSNFLNSRELSDPQPNRNQGQNSHHPSVGSENESSLHLVEVDTIY
jgi:hypothetical protein